MSESDKNPAVTAASPPPSPAVTQEQAAKSPAASPHPVRHDPQQIGPYRILEKIGEGGMGVIYKAEQRQPVRRVVALKVIKLGMDTREVIARFEAERQALAMMSHPNVARVLDAGVTEQGRPYFAMEFVAGIPLDEFCDQKKLSTRQRLMLFVPVCMAVQHAHQKGIIHRDLKPSNVLVMMIDGKACPKVIDFGIAKATNQQLTQQTLFTQTGAMIGTPAYMSPEQARTSGLDVDTRTDIYSLGVMLYQLLTGTLPLDPDELQKAGSDGMARMIQESEPHRPSTRITALRHTPRPDSAPDEIAKKHKTDPKTLHRELRGDLDCIVLKAMEKDPGHRYQTANALGMDIERYLNDEPIAARPPSTTYRLRKLIRRHRIAFAAAAVVLLFLIGGLAATVFELRRAQEERDKALASEVRAQRARSDAVAANVFMRNLFTSTMGSTDSTTRLEESVRRLDKGLLAWQPETEAGCRIMIAQTYMTANMPREAQTQFAEALKLSHQSDAEQRHSIAGMALRGLGNVALKMSDLPAAAKNLQDAATEFRLARGEEAQASAVLESLGSVRQSMGQGQVAHEVRIEALELRVTLLTSQIASHPSDVQAMNERGFAYLRLGQASKAAADFEGAERADPSNYLEWYYLSLSQLNAEDVAGYRKSAAEMLKSFGITQNRQAAGRVAIVCALGNPGVGDMAKVRQIAESAISVDANRAAGRWFYVGKALAQYRDADYPAAMQSLALSRGVVGVFAPTNVDLILAMCQFRSGNTAAARQTYRLAVGRLNGDMQRLDTLPNAINLSDFMICQCLKREADTMFSGRTTSRPATSPVGSQNQ
jgi:serine/threonine protein kinase